MIRTMEGNKRSSALSQIAHISTSISTKSGDKSLCDTTASNSTGTGISIVHKQSNHHPPPPGTLSKGSPRPTEMRYNNNPPISITSPPNSPTSSVCTGSRNFETGKISAFSSVAELKAHLKRNELMREERRRKRELYRQQQVLLKKREGQSHQYQQRRQHQHQQTPPLQQHHQQHQQEEQLPNPLLLTTDPQSNQELHHRRINFIQSPNKEDIMLLSSTTVNDPDFDGVPFPTHHILQTIQEPIKGRSNDNTHVTEDKGWNDHHPQQQQQQQFTYNKPSSPRSVYITTTTIHDDETSAITSPTGVFHEEENMSSSISSMSSFTNKLSLPTKKECGNDKDVTTGNSFRTLKRGNSNRKNKKRAKKFSITKPIRKAIKKMWKKMKPMFGKKDAVNLERSSKGNLC